MTESMVSQRTCSEHKVQSGKHGITQTNTNTTNRKPKPEQTRPTGNHSSHCNMSIMNRKQHPDRRRRKRRKRSDAVLPPHQQLYQL